MISNLFFQFISAFLIFGFSPTAQAGDFDKRADARFGVEINILWPLPPFRTYEIKFTAALNEHFSAVIGYGKQNWNYTGDRHNRGTMDSHALLIGARAFPWRANNTTLEYTAWLGLDHFMDEQGKSYRGFSLAHEFYLGYLLYLGNSRTYVLPQWNAGFYQYKAYTLPKNDNYVFDFLPKISLGRDFK